MHGKSAKREGHGVAVGVGRGLGVDVGFGIAVFVGVGIGIEVAVAVGSGVGVADNCDVTASVGLSVGVCAKADVLSAIEDKVGVGKASPMTVASTAAATVAWTSGDDGLALLQATRNNGVTTRGSNSKFCTSRLTLIPNSNLPNWQSVSNA